jgi:hypothetical protein
LSSANNRHGYREGNSQALYATWVLGECSSHRVGQIQEKNIDFIEAEKIVSPSALGKTLPRCTTALQGFNSLFTMLLPDIRIDSGKRRDFYKNSYRKRLTYSYQGFIWPENRQMFVYPQNVKEEHND